MDSRSKKRITSPWYHQHDDWMRKAADYIRGTSRLRRNSRQWSQIHSYAEFAAAKLVFESNAIERSGTSLGETRAIIEGLIPAERVAVRVEGKDREQLVVPVLGRIRELTSAIRSSSSSGNVEPPNGEALVRFAGRGRRFLEVALHYLVLLQVYGLAVRYHGKQATFDLSRKYHDLEGIPFNSRLEVDDDGYVLRLPQCVRAPIFVTQARLRCWHRDLSSGLGEAEWKVEPGEYRIDSRSAGWDVGFCAPDLISRSMARFVKEFNRTAREVYTGDTSAIVAAARLSHAFVSIHPFPDFNGRLSRLVLAAVLFIGKVPFCVTLRGDSKWRARYRRALRAADKGDLKPYTTLIAMSVCEGYAELNRHLIGAGLRPIRA